MSIHWPILRRCLRSPLSLAVTDDQRAYSRAAILAGAFAVAERIAAVSRTPAVGVCLPTSGAFPIAALGAWIAGKVVVPLNYLLKPDELQFVVDDCRADTIISAQPMLDHLGAIPRGPAILRLEDIDFKAVPEPRWPAFPSDDDLGLLLYTSGTSGRPKGVMLTHGNIASNIRQIQEWIRFPPNTVFLGVLPQFHSFGLTALTLLPLTVGCKAVFTARFVPNRIVRLIRQHRPNVLIAIPSMYNALLHAKDATPQDFASVFYAVSGGEPLPKAVAAAFKERFGVTIAEGYGLTETSPATNWCRPQDYRPSSVGMPLPGVIERIVDIPTNRDLPRGAEGEIRIAGPNVMRGYFNRPDETAAAFDERGFFRTGDIGKFDEAGHLYITGRLKDMLIIGGENVFPREIEEALNAHPAVKDSGVVGVMDPVRGEQPIAFVELKDDALAHPPSQTDLLAHCRSRLAGYKVPAEIRVIATLPRNPTGKVLRRELRALL